MSISTSCLLGLFPVCGTAKGTLRKKTEPKQCPLGTVLKNGALCSKKGIKTVPLWESAPHQKGTIFHFAVLEKGHCFRCKKRSKMVPFFFKGAPFWCPLIKGTVLTATKGKKWCRLAKGYRISALGALFLYGKDRKNLCPFAKGHQNSAPKDTVLWTVKRCPYGTISVPSIFLSVV